MLLFSLALLAAGDPQITVEAPGSKEIGYAAGSLGYDALVKRDYAAAERQLLAAGPEARTDSAWLINYGQVLARTGRVVDAAAAFRRASLMADGDLILADGREMSSREAALLALANLQTTRTAGR